MSQKTDGIAVIGMAGRFPGASNIQEFWKNLCDSTDVGTEFDLEQLKKRIPSSLAEKENYVRRGYVLENAESFDATFFGYTPSDARGIDPQQRQLLEVAWEAIEDSGYAPSSIKNDSVGVFASVSPSSAASLSTSSFCSDPGAYMATLLGNDKDYAATRISYKLTLRGPSMSVQTACSSSLVGVAMACQSLLNYECDYALAGGATIIFPQDCGYLSMDEGGLSKDGRCHAFDHRASGMNFGNGAAMVFLKRLDEALAANDHIYGVIKGYAVNNDGSAKVGFTAPSIQGQEAVIREALEVSGIDPATVSYIEAHGTGTPMGDPMEIKALDAAYGREGFPLVIGSAKSNVGHLNAAAGVTGLIKAMLSLEHAKIPGLMNFEAPNPALELEGSRICLGRELRDWEPEVRRAGVSSFGLGGTNCHLVLEQAPAAKKAEPDSKTRVFPFSARSEQALETQTARLSSWLAAHPEASPADVAHTLQHGREVFGCRRAVIASSIAELKDFLDRKVWLSGRERTLSEGKADVCFLFPGTGSQSAHMGRGLYESEPVYRENMDYCCRLINPLLGEDLLSIIYPADKAGEAKLATPRFGFPALFAVEYSLARLWMSRGIIPTSVGGHSFGQYAAAVIAGVFSIEDAVRIVVKRGELMERTAEGKMLLVFSPEEAVRPLLFGSLSIAVINTERLCTVAGLPDEVDELSKRFAENRIHCRSVSAARAGHSCLMDPVLGEFRDFMASVHMKAPDLPILSNVTGTWMTDEEATSPDAWAGHIRKTVRFSDNLSKVLEQEGSILLEVGPGRVLAALAGRHPMAKDHSVIASMKDAGSNDDDRSVFLRAQAAMFTAGAGVLWEMEGASRISLPTYPFDQKLFPVLPAPAEDRKGGKALLGSLMDKRDSIDDWFFMPLWRRVSRLQAAHRTGAMPERWLVFADKAGLGDAVAAELRSMGRSVVVARQGEGYAENGDEFTLNPAGEEDYASMFRELAKSGRVPERIVHAWSFSLDGEYSRGEETLQVFNALGYRSLVNLVRGLTAADMDGDMGLAVLTSQLHSVTGSEELLPEKSLVLGPCRVIPSEYRGIQTLNIDLDSAGSIDDAVVGTVIRDVSSMPSGTEEVPGFVPVVAYRGAFRWEQFFGRVSVARPEEDAVPLRQNGCYVITGGFGGVATVLSNYLAEKYHARLVLTGRSDIPRREEWNAWIESHDEQDGISSKIRTVLDLERKGAEVLFVRADCAQKEDMERVWKETSSRFGHVDGIFHAASIAASSMIQAQTEARAASVIGTKVAGALNIERFAEKEKPDFVLLFSSISSHVGALGHTDYTGACLFLDTLAHSLNGKAPYRTVAVNWGYWQGVGIGNQLLPKLTELLGDDIPVRGIMPAEGMECIERVLAAPADQIVVSTSDYSVLMDVFLRNTKESLRNYETYTVQEQSSVRPSLAVAYREPSTPVEKVVALVWQELLGFSGIGADDGFIELGGDSLHALPMVGKLEEIFHIKVPIRCIVTENTVSRMAAWLVQNEKSEGQVMRIAQMYLKIKSMSPEQIRRMMEQQGRGMKAKA